MTSAPFVAASGARETALQAIGRAPDDLLIATLDSLRFGVLALDSVRDDGGAIVDFRCRFANSVISTADWKVRTGKNLLQQMPSFRATGLFEKFVAVAEQGLALDTDFHQGNHETRRWLRVGAQKLGDGLVVTLTDVTARKLQEAALHEAREAVEEANRAKDDFLATVSYELRTPLNTIVGFSELIGEEVLGPVQPPKYVEYATDILKSARRIQAVVNDFLEMKRLEGMDGHDKDYRNLIDLAPDMICLCRGGKVVLLNAAGANMIGVWPTAAMVGQPVDSFVHGDYHPIIERDFESLIDERGRVPMKFIRCDGIEVDVEVAARPYREEGRERAVMLVARDITERNRQTRAILAREERLRRVMETVPDGIVIIDEQGVIDSFNLAAERIFGFSSQDVLGLNVSILKCEPLTALRDEPAEAFSAVRNVRSREAEAARKDGAVFPVEVSVSELVLGNKRLFVGLIRDITKRKQAEEYLRFLANHDALTGLPNRTLFHQCLQEAIAEANRRQRLVAILFIDLDHFKNINDSMGHPFGDRVLQEVGRRLETSVRDVDTVARLSGDEFTIILPDLDDVESASALAHLVLHHLSQPFTVDGKDVYVTGSIGVALYPDHAVDVETLLQNVDMAAYRAKEIGRNNCQFFDERLSAKSAHRVAMENGLRHALARREFEVVLQPQISIATGEMVGAEALLRWNSPDLGSVSPALFIPVAEETGLIVPIGDWVIHSVCLQLSTWAKSGLRPVPIAVNLSARQFHQSDLAMRIASIMAETELPPGLLEMELTESMLVENADEAIETMNSLKTLGITLSIDDFGTGYSSLSYLKRFPLDALKIDQSFVRDIPNDEDDMVIARAIIMMAQSLGLKIIAEGVENEQQVAFLRQQNCDVGQGYHYSRPLSVAAYETFLKARA